MRERVLILRILLAAGLLAAAGCERAAEETAAQDEAALCRPASIEPAALGVGPLDFGPGEVTAALYDGGTGQPAIQFKLAEDRAAALADITGQSIGEPLPLMIDGEIVTAPIVQERIEGGEIVVSGNFTLEEVEAIIVRFGPPCEAASE